MDNVVAIEIKKCSKIYHKNGKDIVALKNINLSFEYGKFYLIVGHSGSGKTTLMNILGLIDSKYHGIVKINNKEVNNLKLKELAKIRNTNIGFIFQDFYLDNFLTAQENVLTPMLINQKKYSYKEMEDKSQILLDKVGLSERIKHFPKELSGGEQQRVAIARALANNPNIILADEPTGNLDVENEEYIFNLLKEMSKNFKCIIMVSHSKDAKKYADVVYNLENGEINYDKN